MKIYEKPRLMMVALSGNGSLCESCAIDAVGDNKAEEIKRLYEIYGESAVLFTADGTDCAIRIDAYCKFTSVESGLPMIFNS